MLKVHHLQVSQSDRIAWLCEELGLPYELVLYKRDPRLAPEAYRALHPSGTAPVIEDDGLVLAETGAIVDYIVARHGGGRLTVPPSDPEFANYLFWYHLANGSFMPAMMMKLSRGMTLEFAQERIDRYLAALEAHLADGREWLADDRFTVADIVMLFPLTTMRLFVPQDISVYPNIRAYVRRVTDRPAFQAAKAKADPELVLPLD